MVSGVTFVPSELRGCVLETTMLFRRPPCRRLRPEYPFLHTDVSAKGDRAAP